MLFVAHMLTMLVRRIPPLQKGETHFVFQQMHEKEVSQVCRGLVLFAQSGGEGVMCGVFGRERPKTKRLLQRL